MAVESGRIRRRVAVSLGAAAIAGGGLLAAGATAADLASESPQQIVQAVAAAVHGAKGYQLNAVIHQTSGTERLNLIDAGGGAFDIQVEQGQETARIILISHKAYMKASTSFWVAQGVGKKLAQQLAPHWYKVPASEFTKAAGGLRQFEPSTLAQCIKQGNGQLTNAGTATVNGQRAVILKGAGGEPGTGPGTVEIAATGKPYPLRITETGPTLAGGTVNACNDGKASKATGTVTMSHWDKPPVVKAPPNPITLPNS